MRQLSAADVSREDKKRDSDDRTVFQSALTVSAELATHVNATSSPLAITAGDMQDG